MEFVTQLFVEIGPYHWLALAALLIAIEMVMPTQYLIWPGIAAAVVGLLTFMVELSLPGEIGVFAVLSAILVGLSHHYFPKGTSDAKSSLNQRTDQMVGKTAVVAEGFQNGQGSVTVGDTRWVAQSVDGADYAEGTRVSVISAESTLLTVKRL
jgi:membrane protein implicated in regulation of membrane protease activity